MMIMLLFNVHTHAHDYCVFVCAAVLLYVAVLDAPVTKGSQWLRYLLVSYPLVSWILFVAEPLIQNVLKLQPLAVHIAVVLALSVVVWFGKRGDRAESGEMETGT